MFMIKCTHCNNYISLYVNNNYYFLNIRLVFNRKLKFNRIHCFKCNKYVGVIYCIDCINPYKIKSFTKELWISNIEKIKDSIKNNCNKKSSDVMYFKNEVFYSQQWFFINRI